MFKFEIDVGNSLYFFFIEILTLTLLYLGTYILILGKTFVKLTLLHF